MDRRGAWGIIAPKPLESSTPVYCSDINFLAQRICEQWHGGIVEYEARVKLKTGEQKTEKKVLEYNHIMDTFLCELGLDYRQKRNYLPLTYSEMKDRIITCGKMIKQWNSLKMCLPREMYKVGLDQETLLGEVEQHIKRRLTSGGNKKNLLTAREANEMITLMFSYDGGETADSDKHYSKRADTVIANVMGLNCQPKRCSPDMVGLPETVQELKERVQAIYDQTLEQERAKIKAMYALYDEDDVQPGEQNQTKPKEVQSGDIKRLAFYPYAMTLADYMISDRQEQKRGAISSRR